MSLHRILTPTTLLSADWCGCTRVSQSVCEAACTRHCLLPSLPPLRSQRTVCRPLQILASGLCHLSSAVGQHPRSKAHEGSSSSPSCKGGRWMPRQSSGVRTCTEYAELRMDSTASPQSRKQHTLQAYVMSHDSLLDSDEWKGRSVCSNFLLLNGVDPIRVVTEYGVSVVKCSASVNNVASCGMWISMGRVSHSH